MTQLFAPNFQRVDANGAPYSGAKLYFYQSGTTTLITVYQDSAKATPHTNPVVADTSGAFPEIYIDTDPYKYVLTTSSGTLIETADAVPLLAGASIVGSDLLAIEALSGTGIATRTAANTWALRTVTAGTGITLTNGDGVSGNPSVSVDAASAANYRANTADKVLLTDDVWSAAAEVTLTDAATIAVDMSTFINAVVTLGGNRTLGQPSNTKVGQAGVILGLCLDFADGAFADLVVAAATRAAEIFLGAAHVA